VNRRSVIAGLLMTVTISRANSQQKERVYRLAITHPSHPLSELNETGSRPSFRAVLDMIPIST